MTINIISSFRQIAQWFEPVLGMCKVMGLNPIQTSSYKELKSLRPKEIILLFPEIPVTNKIFFNRVAAKKTFFINLVEFFKQSLHLKNYSNSTFLCWKTKSPIFYFFKRKKRKFTQINLLVAIFFVYVCLFLKQKIYILIHIWLMQASRW